MYFKLSLKNVKKSFKDYTLYFLTLSFSVCIFYIFNSIEAQKAMLSISRSANTVLQTITNMMAVISVFVSFILGFLIVYANHFLIRRRKKELGIYMTLGMGRGTLAKMLVSETFSIGLFSLATGLIAGIFISQGLSAVTAGLFNVDMTAYRFIFSYEAFIKTILYFGIIFLVVMILSTISISKYKLIDLIHADKQNEKLKIKNPIFTTLLFVLSIISIGTAYVMVMETGIGTFDNRLLLEVILGAVGTFLFFASLAGFFLRIAQSRKRTYFRDLNMFILRQINARINTAHISMSFICLMLFCTIGILSTGMGANNALNSSYQYCAPFDASFRSVGDVNISETMKKYGFDVADYAEDYVSSALYKGKDNPTKGLILSRIREHVPDKSYGFLSSQPLYLIRLSDFNALMRLQGAEGIQLSDHQAALYSDYAESTPQLKDALLSYIALHEPITLQGESFEVYPELQTLGIITSTNSDIMMALIVPDRITDTATVVESDLAIELKGNDDKAAQYKLEEELLALKEKNTGIDEEIKIKAATAESVKAIAAGSKALVTYICIYLGLIFLITSAAVLALQQLSEATDNKKRYHILQKVGADQALIQKALFRQIAIYFLLPLAVACIHAIVGIKVANELISEAGGIDALGNIITTAVVILLVYGSYFLATYFSSKSIILKNPTS